MSSFEVGSVVEGTVSGLTNFGAFVLLPNGKTGLVHISEVAQGFVKDIREHLQEQQKVQVKVVSVEGHKIALSIRQASPTFQPAPPGRSRERRASGSFEDKMARFLRDSEDRLGDLRRVEGKRGGRGGRNGSAE